MNVVAGVRERAWSISVPHHARGASLARRRLRAGLAELGVTGELAADAMSVVSELVGNAARHARPLRGGIVELSWSVGPGWVELRVTDGGAVRPPRLRTTGPDAIDGRGLQIVAALADRWGVDSADAGRCVWVELRG